MSIRATSEPLFFASIRHATHELLPILYTPTVGLACQEFSSLIMRPWGLWLGIKTSKGNIRKQLDCWGQDVKVVCVTDGERILGLGDLGANGIGISVGKLVLYSACGGVPPECCLPVVLDTGCDGPSRIERDYYNGEDHGRVRGEEYDEFVHEFFEAVVDKWGISTLIQFEDFANRNAARLLEKYRNDYCTFNDDIQGTAAVALAGLFKACNDLAEHTFLFYGAGSAGLGIADLIVEELVTTKGMDRADAKRKCWFIDSKGLIRKGRERVTAEKERYAHEVDDKLLNAVSDRELLSIVKAIKPSVLVGVSTIPKSFSSQVLRHMAKINKRPVIFALSNPTSKSECTAEEAYKETEGRAIFASGSPFAPVKLEDHDKVFVPGQGNNCYVFPGIGLGVVLSGARIITESMFLNAAKSLASLVDKERLESGCVYPPLDNILECSAHVAYAICQDAKCLGLNERNVDHLTPEQIRKEMYDPEAVKIST